MKPRFACLLLAVLCSVCLGISRGEAASGILISEFMAENNGFYFDQDGDSPDWIELKNESGVSVDLAGWHLTDESTNLTKWTFPATILPANGYLVVFASGKDRAVSGEELHTNFQLDNQGEYLGLVEPDGVTVAQQFAPAYAPQRANVSYGTERLVTEIPLVAEGHLASYWIPGDGSVDGAWVEAGYDDGGWDTGVSGLGFDLGSGGSGGSAGDPQGTVVLAIDFNDDDMGESGAANTEEGFDTMTLSGNPATFGSISVTLSALGGGVLDDRDRSVPVDSPPALTQDQLYDDFIFVNGTTDGNGGRIHITGLSPNTDYALTVWSYDNSSVNERVSDWIEVASGVTNVVATAYRFDGSLVPTQDGEDTFGGLVRSSVSGELILEGRRHGGTSHGVFMNALRLVQLGFGGAIATDLSGAMAGQSASAYMRFPFQREPGGEAQSLRLRMKYDDGFVAYLNGTQVASRNAPAMPSWDSTATAEHPNAEALAFEEILLPEAGSLLVAGENVLAIHGLNIGAGDEDFLMVPVLDVVNVQEAAGLYLKPPTPGEPNGPGYPGFVEDTTFSVDRGFYDAPFTVEIFSDTANAEIRWTTDGSAPTEGTGNVYSGPILIEGTTFLRAAAFFPGLISSDVDTHTYLFLDEVLQQSNDQPGYPTSWQASYPADYGMDPNVVGDPKYGPGLKDDLRSLPTLSIVADHDDLWGSSGIYNNATGSGLAWERPASVELFQADGTTEFAVVCGLRMQGNASRDNVRTPKHNFRLLFKSIYGPSKLRYDWFGGGVEQFDNIVLRACFTDAWTTRYSPTSPLGVRYRPQDSIYLRDIWMKDTLADMGQPSGRSTHVHLYVNGLYWGLYNPTERLDKSFMEENFGGPAEAWDVIRDFSEVMEGSKADWDAMMAVANAGITTEQRFQELSDLVDVENLIDYMLLHFYGEAEDWPHHNWYAAHRRATNGLPSTKWIFLAWDQEIIADLEVVRDLTDVSNNDTPARIYSQLRAWPEFRRMFGDRVQKHLFNGGALTPEMAGARLQARVQDVYRAMNGESARWGDAREFATPGMVATGETYTRDEYWVPEIDRLMTNWFPRQVGVMISRLRADGLYPLLDAPRVSPFGGEVPNGYELELQNDNVNGTVYFTTDGTDPRVYGTGAIAPMAQAYSDAIVIDGPTLLRARVFYNNQWSALVAADFFPPQDFRPLVLTEIMYHPVAFGAIPETELEFLELKNTGTETLDLTGLMFTEGIDYSFPNGTMLAPGEFFVLARSIGAMIARYGGLVPDGVFEGQLDNGGERITLSHPVGARVLSADYNDQGRWPITPDGFGYSLVPRQPETQPNLSSPAHWRASTEAGGSPGEDDPNPGIAAVYINEILTHTDLPQVDAVELFNPGSEPADLTGWYLTDDREFPWKYRISEGGILAPGGYAVFSETDFNSGPDTNLYFNLSSEGDEVYLFAADGEGRLTGYSDGFNFGAAANGVSFGKYVTSTGDEHYPAMASLTLEGPNSEPQIGPVVVWQFMYHPPDLLGGQDNVAGEYVVLQNVTDQAVALSDSFGNGWQLRDAIDYIFPVGTMLAGGDRLVVVSFDPQDEARTGEFFATYPDLAGHSLYGPYTGKLDNSNERIELVRPDAPNALTGEVPEILVERVHYEDQFPWDPAADGTGGALRRVSLTGYGNDPTNWVSVARLAIYLQPAGQSVFPGDDVTFTVTAAGSGTLTYQWYKDGQPLAGANGNLLALDDVESGDAGMYHVTVTDSTGTVSSQAAQLNVLVAPTIVVQPLSQSVVAGGTVVFSVVTEGSLPMNYRWLKVVTTLRSESIMSNTNYYTISDVQPGDGGFYRVGVSNFVGTIELSSSLANLTVLTDTDGDLMPDEWENTHGFMPDAAEDGEQDADGDGATNREEYEAGTDPLDAGSVFVIETIELSGDQVHVRFQGQRARTYSVLRAEDAASAGWSKVADVPGRVAAGEVDVVDRPAGGTNRFYRVVTPRQP